MSGHREARPAYKSPDYYDIVLRNGTFKGWRCTFVGNGSMQFKHTDGRVFGTQSQPPSEGWHKRCWNRFLDMADPREWP